MNLLLVGHTLIDEIKIIGEPTQVKPGGLFYSAAGIVSIKSEKDDVTILTELDDTGNKYFSDIYNLFDLTPVNQVEKMPRVQLTIHPDKEREEKYYDFPGKLDFGKIDNLEKFDGLYLNMVTGFEIDVTDLKKIRSNYTGLIYIDIHTLSRGVDKEGKRVFRKIPDSEEWIKNVDFIQINEQEIFTISDFNTIGETVEYVLSKGVKAILLTKGDKGSEIFYKNGSKINSIGIKAVDVDVINKVGCGDVFGVVFFYYYILTQDLIPSLKKANAAGGFVTEFIKTSDFLTLKQKLDNIG